MNLRLNVIALILLQCVSGNAAEYNLGELSKSGGLTVSNREVVPAKAGAPEVVFLNGMTGGGAALVNGLEFSQGTIELEIKGRDALGQSFVGIEFHCQDSKTFEAVYLRPFNFQSPERGNHSIQYISMPGHDWNELRTKFPGKYESAIVPAPEPESWVKLKLVVDDKSVSAFVNGSEKPALTVDLLNSHREGKLGLWVGNNSDGWFRNLKVTPAKQATTP